MNPILKYFGIRAYLRSLKKDFYLKIYNKGVECFEHGEWFYDDDKAAQHFQEEHGMPKPTAQKRIERMKRKRK